MVLSVRITRESVLRRVVADATRVLGHRPEVIAQPYGEGNRASVVRLIDTNGELTHPAALLAHHDPAGRNAIRRPPFGRREELVALWRGAFLVAGEVALAPVSAVAIRCPDPIRARSLGAIVNRLGIPTMTYGVHDDPQRPHHAVVAATGDISGAIGAIGGPTARDITEAYKRSAGSDRAKPRDSDPVATPAGQPQSSIDRR